MRVVNKTRIRKSLVDNVLSDANGFEAPQKPILDLERLRQLADIVGPLRKRIEIASNDRASEDACLGESDPAGENRSPDRWHRRERADG